MIYCSSRDAWAPSLVQKGRCEFKDGLFVNKINAGIFQDSELTVRDRLFTFSAQKVGLWSRDAGLADDCV